MEYGRVSIMAIHSPLFWKRAAGSLMDIVDGFIIRLNTEYSNCPSVKELQEFFGDKLIKLIVSPEFKDGYTWREEMIIPLHAIRPSIVVTTDSDESVPVLFRDLLDDFEKSDKKMLMMKARMETEDGRDVFVYPSKPHCRAFKWSPEVTYIPYTGYSFINPYGWKPDLMYNTDMEYKHFAFYTKKLQRAKVKYAKARYGTI